MTGALAQAATCTVLASLDSLRGTSGKVESLFVRNAGSIGAGAMLLSHDRASVKDEAVQLRALSVSFGVGAILSGARTCLSGRQGIAFEFVAVLGLRAARAG